VKPQALAKQPENYGGNLENSGFFPMQKGWKNSGTKYTWWLF
jgi:hypothetical protein